MMGEVKTCFVISPIGEDGSDARQKADDVFDLVIKPAVMGFGFDEVVRADMLIEAGEINSKVIALVQNAELCIVDLTGHNANVFYELGRRHEAAKPYIQIIEVGEKLPFDVQGINTLTYDLSSARSVHGSIEKIRPYVEQFERLGYTRSSTGVSTATLAEVVDRVERKVDRLMEALPRGIQTGGSSMGKGSPSIVSLQDYFDTPAEVFIQAVAVGDRDGALMALRRMRRVSKDTKQVLACSGLLAAEGYEEAADIIIGLFSDGSLESDQELYNVGTSALVRYYNVIRGEVEGVSEIRRLVVPKLEDEAISQIDKAYLVNQLGMISHNAELYEDAQKYHLSAVEWNPSEPAYKYNLSLVYEARGLMDMAERVVDEYMASDKDMESDQLAQAIDIYLKRGRDGDVRSAYEKLQRLDPSKAAVKVAFSDELRSALEE